MDDALLVGVVHGVGEDFQEMGGLNGRKRLAVELFLQAAAIHVFK